MKHLLCLCLFLALAASAFAQVEVLWDVPLAIPVSEDSVLHMRYIFGRLAVWSGENLDVLDTLGAPRWHWQVPQAEGACRILDVAGYSDGGLRLRVAYSCTSVDTTHTIALAEFSISGDSLGRHSLNVGDFEAQLAAVGLAQTVFAGLEPASSLAPHGMVLAKTNALDSVGTCEALPYSMDNCNRFRSIWFADDYGVLLTGTTGLPGECTGVFRAVNTSGYVQGSFTFGREDTVRAFTAIEDRYGPNSGPWMFGVREANVARALVVTSPGHTSPNYLPLAQSWPFFREDAVTFAPENGVLLSGHVGNQANASRTYLMRINHDLEVPWSVTLPAYDRFTHIISHLNGGYLAIAITGSPAAYRLVRFTESITGADRPFGLPPSSFILSAFPNPFNPAAEITFSVPAGKVAVEAFDVSGRLVAVLHDGPLSAGEHRLTFDGSSLPAGIYFLRLEAASRQSAVKLVLLK